MVCVLCVVCSVPSKACSDYDSEASSVGGIGNPKKASDEQALQAMLNPNAGMDGFIGGKRASSLVCYCDGDVLRLRIADCDCDLSK